jgi:hypothetical protein
LIGKDNNEKEIRKEENDDTDDDDGGESEDEKKRDNQQEGVKEYKVKKRRSDPEAPKRPKLPFYLFACEKKGQVLMSGSCLLL